MSFPQPDDPYDLSKYDIDVEFLLEELAARVCKLQQITYFPDVYSKGFHEGQLCELRSISMLIKTQMYKARP